MLSTGSAWWTRGCTLQELIAPATVQFYAADWVQFGEHDDEAEWTQRLTGIPGDVLRGGSPATYSIAQRMSWASSYRTSRLEDQAYCLLGTYSKWEPPADASIQRWHHLNHICDAYMNILQRF